MQMSSETDKRATIVALYNGGVHSIRELARRTKSDRDTVRRALNKAKLAGLLVPAPMPGLVNDHVVDHWPFGEDEEEGAKVGLLRELDEMRRKLASVFEILERPTNEGPPAAQDKATAPAAQPSKTPPGLIYHDSLRPSRIAWLSDLHVPYHDAAAASVALSALEDWRPDLVIVGGDFFDSYLISRHEKEPARLRDTLQGEFDAGQPIAQRIDRIGAPVVYIRGNHEARIDALVGANPGLAELRSLDLKKMAELPSGWSILPQFARYRVRGVDFHHGDLMQGIGGRHVGCNMLMKLKRSNVFGHFHRSQVYGEPDGDGTLRAGFSSGHLCDEAEAGKYCRLNNWAKGFITVDMDNDSGLFEVRSHLVHGGKLRFGGKTYTD